MKWLTYCYCGDSITPAEGFRWGWAHTESGTDRCYPRHKDRSGRQLFARPDEGTR
jgi:hypothetical protein